MAVRALIFDFDGLILETETPAYASWVEIYREHGRELPLDLWLDYVGREGGWWDALDHLETLVGPRPDRESIRARRDARKTELTNAAAEASGLRDLLGAATALGLKRGVASSSTSRWVLGHLERLGLLPFFDHVQCREGALRAKPAPDIYQAACDALGVRPDEAIAFEDSRNGLIAARAAGIYCVVVPNELTALMDLGEADLRCDSLADVPLGVLLARP